MASPVPAKSQPLHNFNLPEQLKWNTDGEHHRRRSVKSPARRPNPLPASPLPHSPMLDSVSATPPRRQSPVYSVKPSPIRGESSSSKVSVVRGDSSSSKPSVNRGESSLSKPPVVRGESSASKPSVIREWLLRQSPIGDDSGRDHDSEPEEAASEKSKGTPLIEYRRNHHSKNSSASDSLRVGGFNALINSERGAAEKIEKKSKVAPEEDVAGIKRSSKKILIKIPYKNKKPEESNRQEEPHSQKNKKDEANPKEEPPRKKHKHKHEVANRKEHSPCNKIKQEEAKEEPFCKKNNLEESNRKEDTPCNKNKQEEVAICKGEVVPYKKRKHEEANVKEEAPNKTIKQEVANQNEEPSGKKNKQEVENRKEEPSGKKNKQEEANRKEESFCKRNKLEEANRKEDRVKIEGNDVDGGNDDLVQEEEKIGSSNNVIDDDTKIWNLRPRKPFRKSLNVSGGGSAVKNIGSYKGETSKPQSPSGNVNKKSGENEENGSGGGGEKKEKVKLTINVALTKREIEEDIFAFTGMKPSRRPQKRAKNVQKQIDAISPGMWLVGITPDSYKVSERSMKG